MSHWPVVVEPRMDGTAFELHWSFGHRFWDDEVVRRNCHCQSGVLVWRDGQPRYPQSY